MTATVTPGASPDKVAARPMSDVDDVDHIMSAYDDGWADDVGRAVELNADALFTWDYERTRPALSKLYEKAKTSQLSLIHISEPRDRTRSRMPSSA